MTGLTVEKVREAREKLKACEIKPHRSYIGFSSEGPYTPTEEEVKNERQRMQNKKR